MTRFWVIGFLAGAALCLIAGLAVPKLAAVALIAVCAATMIGTRDYLNPAYLLGIALNADLLLGGLNFSLFRGVIQDNTFRVIFLDCAAATLAVGIFTVGVGNSQRPGPSPNINVSIAAVMVSTIPGVLGVLMAIQETHAIGLIKPDARFLMSGNAATLAESLVVSAALQGYRIVLLRKRTLLDWGVLALINFLLLMPGYRGWMLISVGIFLIAAGGSGRLKISLSAIGITSVAGFAMLTLISLYRRQASVSAITAERAAAAFRVHLPLALQANHMYLRDAIAITQKLVNGQYPQRIDHWMMFYDLKALGPHERGLPPAAQIIARALGESNTGASLTPGAPGMMYLLMGEASFLGFAALGALLGLGWRFFRQTGNLMAGFVCAFAVVYSIHWFNRGIIAPKYILLPLYFFVFLYGYRILGGFFGWPVVRAARPAAGLRPVGASSAASMPITQIIEEPAPAGPAPAPSTPRIAVVDLESGVAARPAPQPAAPPSPRAGRIAVRDLDADEPAGPSRS